MAKKRSAPESATPAPTAEIAWLDGGAGYTIALAGDKLLCRNAAGKQLASVPKAVRDGEPAEKLLALREWLDGHERECRDTVESWMLRSLPVPRRVLETTWPDVAWRGPLENLIVQGDEEVGILRGIDPKRGVGVVDLDGETRWLDTDALTIPHPILIAELADFRGLASELKLEQRLSQLFREVFPKPKKLDAKQTSLNDFSGGEFKQLVHALGKCRSLGYPVRGGFACCRVLEAGKTVEARFWVGSDEPEAPTTTGELGWVDEKETPLELGDVGPVAFSEGMRMASSIHAARVPTPEGEGR